MLAIRDYRASSARAVLRFFSHFFKPVTPDPDHVHWADFAQSLPRAPFIVWLANEVALDLISHRPHHVSIDDLIVCVDDDTACCLQHDAERFLEKQFGLHRYEPRHQRVMVVFRHLIQHKLKMAK
jgi:hypothetical protein